nr:reverse transcriptase domain-containing protein [Tanacetum cinerariifolium]
MPRECLKIIERKSKVHQSRAKAVVAKVSTSSSTPAISSEVSELNDMVRALLLDKKNQSSALASSSIPAPVKAIEPNCVTWGGAQSYQNCPATIGNVYRDNIQEYMSQAVTANYNQGNTGFRPQKVATSIKANFIDPSFKEYAKPGSKCAKPVSRTANPNSQFNEHAVQIRPTIPTQSKVVKQGTEVTKDQVQTLSSQSTVPVQPPVIRSKTQTLVSEPVVAPVSVSMPNLKPSIPYPSRRDNERRRDQANKQIEKFYEIFKEMSFKISFTDALILLPKFASTLKDLIRNKEKLKLTPTCMTLELTDRSVSKPIGIAKDVSIKFGIFHFPADFVVVDFEPDPRVPLILERCFLKTGRALIDVHKGELSLRIRNKAITYNLDQTSRYSANYNQMTANKIDVICEEYSPKVLSFSDTTASGNPTPYDDPIVSTTSPTLTLFRDSDFLLFEEADAFLGLEDDPNSPEFNPFYYDPEGDIILLEAILNSKPLLPLPNHEQYMPSFKKELKVCKAKTVKSSVDEPPEVELKDLPPHLEYVFLEGDNKLPIIIAKELRDEGKSDLIKVLKSHKRAIARKLSDIQGINLEFCTHKILMKEDYKPAVHHQRRVNSKIHDVIKKEVEKLLDAGLIYPISDSPWVSPVHCVPKKGGFTVIENEENELIPTRLVTGWRVCIDYHKLNEATRKDHFPLPFMDQMLKRLAENEFYCFLDGFSRNFQIPIDPRDQEKTTFTCPYGTFAYRRMPFGLCNALGTFQRCMLAIFHNMVEKTIEVFMDDFSVFGNYFENCRSRVDKMLQRAKVDVIAKLPHPTTVEAKALPTNDARVVCKFLKSLFARFGSPRAIISDRGTHFCSDQFTKVMLKYGVTHCLSTAYHPQTSGQVEVSNRGLKRILERTIGENRASWSDKLDDALWAFCTAYKTPIGCTPYKLVYGKACHLPIELEHKAYWALKQAKFDLAVAGDHQKNLMNFVIMPMKIH